MKKEILDLPAKWEVALDNVQEIKELGNKVYTKKDMFFLGRGIDYYTAQEGSIYTFWSLYSGELKQG